MIAAPDTHVLVIEDNAMNADVLRENLEEAGFRFALAVNGASGVAVANDTLPDIILMDVNLPILDVLTPSLAIVPVSLMSVAFKTLDRLEHHPFFADILIKPSEATETFFHMFIMFYTIMLYQRLAGAAKSAG